MTFDTAAYGPEVAALLALDGHGERPLPLVQRRCAPAEARRRLQAATARELFPTSVCPEPAFAGLWLYFGGWAEAHDGVQDLPGREAAYWHAIVHRMEPDAWNAGYWFHQVGAHAIFGKLRAEAVARGIDFGPRWDPFAFVEWCEEARRKPGGEGERQASAVQLIEWQLLFDFCARHAIAS